MKYLFGFLFLLLFAAPSQFAQNNKTVSQKSEKQIWIRLKTGQVLTGNLVQIDSESVDFKVKNILQSVPFDDVAMISFILPPTKPTPGQPIPTPTPSPTPTPTPTPAPTSMLSPEIVPMSQSIRPVILYKEKARYTESARRKKIEGNVILNVVFSSGGSIENIRVVRGLPEGLTEKAIEAAKQIRFTPAIKDGNQVSVRGNLGRSATPEGQATTPGTRQRRRAARLSDAAGVEACQGCLVSSARPAPFSATPDGGSLIFSTTGCHTRHSRLHSAGSR